MCVLLLIFAISALMVLVRFTQGLRLFYYIVSIQVSISCMSFCQVTAIIIIIIISEYMYTPKSLSGQLANQRVIQKSESD